MLKKLFSIDHSIVNSCDFAGYYSLYHDGWYGSLELLHEQKGKLRGTYNSVRFRQAYNVTAMVDEKHQHQIQLVIHEFNHNLPSEQVFTGYLFTHGKNVIAGRTIWREKPFGFFARKSGFLYLSDYGEGRESILPEDFAGSYGLYHNGKLATLILTHQNENFLSGIYIVSDLTSEFQIFATVSNKIPHEISISVAANTGEFVRMIGYLFTRPKNVIAGYIEWGAIRSGFYMTKFCNPCSLTASKRL
jgi:hypothetical protein